MNDPKGGVAKVTCPTFEAMGQIPMFHRTYFLLYQILYGYGKSATQGVPVLINQIFEKFKMVDGRHLGFRFCAIISASINIFACFIC